MLQLKNKYLNNEIYTTPAGVQLLKEWKPRDFEAITAAAEKAAEKVRNQCDIINGSGRTASELFGLPYTSSSAHAAIWNCQAEARRRGSDLFFRGDLYFRGIACSPSGALVVIWDIIKEGADAGTVYEVIFEAGSVYEVIEDE